MRCLLAVLIVALAACQTTRTKPQVVEIPGPTVYVTIPPKMTYHPPLPALVSTGPLQCPAVAKERLDLLGGAYRQLDAIQAVQGTKP